MTAPFKHKLITAALCAAFLAGVSVQAAELATAPGASAVAAVKPGDDFFGYANAEWLAKTEIPADRGSWGGGAQLGEESNKRIIKLIEALAADKAAKGESRMVADYYTSYMDEAAIEAK